MARTGKGRLKCTPELVAEISRGIVAGSSMKSAAGSVEIDYSTLKRWQAWEREGKEPFAALCAPLKRARYEAIGNAEQRVYAGKGGWQAAARWLESTCPEQWRRTERREISSQVDVRIAWPDLARPGQAAALRRAEAVEKAIAGGQGQAPPVESAPRPAVHEGGRP